MLVFIFRSKQWMVNCRRADLDGLTVERLNSSHRLCANHFEQSQFMNFRRDSLVFNAVPTIFDVPNPPVTLQMKRKLVQRAEISRKKAKITPTTATEPNESVISVPEKPKATGKEQELQREIHRLRSKVYRLELKLKQQPKSSKK